MTVRMIAAVSLNCVFGNADTNDLPWGNKYPEDLNFFKQQTLNSTIIFGRKTYESIGSEPLPKRRNILVTSKPIDTIENYKTLHGAINAADNDAWLIGGLGIYCEGLILADELYITSIPEIIQGSNLIYFPYINPNIYMLSDEIEINKNKKLICNVYKRKSPSM
jgi:dihydrofolate reductase